MRAIGKKKSRVRNKEQREKKFLRGRTRRKIREESLPTTNKKRTSKGGGQR